MPSIKCGLGFDCASMMQQSGIAPGDCLNYTTCGAAMEYSPEEEFELIQIRNLEIEVLRITRHSAAIMMLMARGNPQSLESMGVNQLIDEIVGTVVDVQNRLSHYEGQYIAPAECEAHRYNVKRGSRVYWYNKLTAHTPIFAPSEKPQNVRVIHLSKDSDPRNIEGRLGIERRNRLTQARTQLQVAMDALAKALMLLPERLSDEVVIPGNDMETTVTNSTLEAVEATS